MKHWEYSGRCFEMQLSPIPQRLLIGYKKEMKKHIFLTGMLINIIIISGHSLISHSVQVQQSLIYLSTGLRTLNGRQFRDNQRDSQNK